jgi:hypothetical protein
MYVHDLYLCYFMPIGDALVEEIGAVSLGSFVYMSRFFYIDVADEWGLTKGMILVPLNKS